MSVKRWNFVITLSLLMLVIILFLNQKTVFAQPPGWSEDIKITNASSYRGDPSIDINGDDIYVVWEDGRGEQAYDDYEIYFKKITNNSKTWSADRRLSNAPHYSNFPKIAVNGSNIHVIWADDREGGVKVFYNRSEDAGETWIGEKRISPETTKGSPDSLDIALNRSKVHVVYSDYSEDEGSDFQLYYINSTDNGQTWSNRQRLTSVIRWSEIPAIDVNGSNVHIVWTDYHDKNGQSIPGGIFYINSTDNGLTWNEEINLTDLNTGSAYPGIAVSGDNLHIVYKSKINGIRQVCYRRSENSGITWTEEVKLSNSTTDIYYPAIALNGIDIHVIWTDERDGNREIYYKYSFDNGENWSDDIRLTYDPAQSITQDIAVNDKVHVVFGDDRSGDMEIYYKFYPFYHPPTNLTIDIWRTNLTLNWTTPKDSLSPLDYYLIYRVTDPEAFTFSDSEIIYNSSTNLGHELDTTWNDTTALLDEANNYYYVVRAVYEDGGIDTNENIVGKFMIPLNQGWNLISLPLTQNDTSNSQVLKLINGNYNTVQWYDAKNGIWRSSSTSLTNINRTMGLWVHMKNSCNLSIVGAVPESTDITLCEGWNLVGYPSLKTRNLNDALSGITWQAVQHYNAFDYNDPWKHNSTKKPNNLNDLKEMQPGHGYWVYVTINDTWVRTRVAEENKMVIWRIGESEERIVNDQPTFEPTIENPMEIEQENDYQGNIIPEQPTVKEKEDSFTVSIIPLIILIAFVFTEIILLHKKRR